MSYIIHKQEIRMLDPKEFHYMYVLTAEIKKKKKGKTKKSETKWDWGETFFEFPLVISKTKSSVRVIKNEIKATDSQQCSTPEWASTTKSTTWWVQVEGNSVFCHVLSK